MKIRTIVLLAILGIASSSCHDLDLEPKGILSETELFGNESGVEKYLAGLYNHLPIEDFNYYYNKFQKGYGNPWEGGKWNLANMCGELFSYWGEVKEDGFGYWPYYKIRDVNVFIANFPRYADNFTKEKADEIMGEAHFLRAFFYWGLVKRYGGVPIITEVQDPTADIETLKVPRDSEDAVWQFIHDELQLAIDMLPANKEKKRANKYVAAALMSRAMLYAGRIAKYSHYLNLGTNQEAAQKGLVGIAPERAAYYFTESYQAGKLIDNSGQYFLYRKYDDLAYNFAMLFQDPDSPEDIFVKQYDRNSPEWMDLSHSYDAVMVPIDFSSFLGLGGCPHIHMMKYYDFPAIVDTDGKPVRFDDKADIKNGMEPRLRGTMYFTGDPLRGKVMDIHRGLYKQYTWTAAEAEYGSEVAAPNLDGNRILSDAPGNTYHWNGKDYEIAGKHGIIQYRWESYSMTGAVVRKYVDESKPVSECVVGGSSSPYKVFRLGEIYLNIAEAAYELGTPEKQAEAAGYIAKLRDRAGASPHKMVANPADLSSKYGFPLDANLQYIRDERYRELAFENHYWWDLRSWGVVDQELHNFFPRYLSAYYILDEGKWIYLEEDNGLAKYYTVSKRGFYEPIPAGEIAKNDLLIQNPLW